MKQYEKKSMGMLYKVQEFMSIHEFFNYLKRAEVVNPAFKRTGKKSSHEAGDTYFYGTSTYQEAVDLLHDGWDEGSKRITDSLKVADQPNGTGRRSEYSVVGYQASVPRYLKGVPTNMIMTRHIKKKQPVVTISRNIGFLASWSTERMIEEGVKALEIVRAIERKGIRVRLNIIMSINCYGEETIMCRVCIKQPSERLQVAKMAFMLAHPSMFRRLGFRWIETHPTLAVDITSGYGRQSRLSELKEVFEQEEGEYCLDSHIDNAEEVLENLFKEIL